MYWSENGEQNVFKTYCLQKIEGNIREAVDQEEKYAMDWKQHRSLYILVTG